jgi:hypothetical protein
MNCKDSESWKIIRNIFEKYEPDISIIFHCTYRCLLLKLSDLYTVVDFFHSRNRVWLFNGTVVIVCRIKWEMIVTGEQAMIFKDASFARLKVLRRRLSEETEETYRIVRSVLGAYWVACSPPDRQHWIEYCATRLHWPVLARVERIAAEMLHFVHQF